MERELLGPGTMLNLLTRCQIAFHRNCTIPSYLRYSVLQWTSSYLVVRGRGIIWAQSSLLKLASVHTHLQTVLDTAWVSQNKGVTVSQSENLTESSQRHFIFFWRDSGKGEVEREEGMERGRERDLQFHYFMKLPPTGGDQGLEPGFLD